MLHTDDNRVRSRLFCGNFGLEKESLRILSDGTMSNTLHPFPDDKHIVYDFCENQTEINTSVAQSAEDVVRLLSDHTVHIQKTLAGMEPAELLWPFSNPPYIRSEKDIPIARNDEKDLYRKGYRDYLGNRYGRYKMSLSGIHVNYSFSEDLLREDYHLGNYQDFRKYKDDLYLMLAEKLAAYGWIITVLTAASPLMDSSYTEKGVLGKTSFNGMASTRCSELGYWNYFVPVFDYSDIPSYADSIRKYVDLGMIAAETELYYPIRLKSAGKNSLERLKKEGVDHIEIRVVDLNPLEFSGINMLDLKFIQILMVWLASTPREPLDEKDQVQVVQNYKNAAHYDLKTVKIVVPDGEAIPVADAGLAVLEEMKAFFKGYPEEIQQVLSFEEEKLLDPEKRYAWRIRREFADGFVEKGLLLAKQLQEEAVNV